MVAFNAGHGVIGLEFLSEAALIAEPSNGTIRNTNTAARQLLGAGALASSLLEFVTDRNGTAEYLKASAGSTSSRVGSIIIGVERFRSFAARLHLAGSDEALLIIRLRAANDDHFSILNREIRELNDSLRQRSRDNALLQEALSHNQVLNRELQHRIKNNIQQMLSLIKASAHGMQSPESIQLVDSVTHRLQALAVAQEAIYESGSASEISADSFLGTLVMTTATAYGVADRLSADIAAVRLTTVQAQSLALITNELVTNACKYGMRDGGRLTVAHSADSNSMCLEVRDQGPGFDIATSSRSSGLTLVRGLCRQLGAALEVSSENGTRCHVRFDRSATHAEG